MSTAILVTEIILCYKYRAGTGNLLDNPTPWYIWGPWTITIVSCVVFWFYLRFKKDHTVKYPGYERRGCVVTGPAKKRAVKAKTK